MLGRFSLREKFAGEKGVWGKRCVGRKVCGEKGVWGERFRGERCVGEIFSPGRFSTRGERCVSHLYLCTNICTFKFRTFDEIFFSSQNNFVIGVSCNPSK